MTKSTDTRSALRAMFQNHKASKGTPKVHYRGSKGKAVCGQRNGRETGKWTEVTCSRCLHSNSR